MRVRTQGEATVLEIGGEMDLHSAPPLRAALLELTQVKGARIVVDLNEVTFIDSTGIGALVGALKRAREGGGALHFCGAQPRVRRVFEITGLLGALPIFDSREAALGGFSKLGANSDSANAGSNGTLSGVSVPVKSEAAHDG